MAFNKSHIGMIAYRGHLITIIIFPGRGARARARGQLFFLPPFLWRRPCYWSIKTFTLAVNRILPQNEPKLTQIYTCVQKIHWHYREKNPNTTKNVDVGYV